MTLQELAAETLTQKNRRLRQVRCPHEEIFASTVYAPDGTHEARACMDCGKTWNESRSR